MEISQGQESESAWEEMISLIGTLWGLYVLCGKYFCYPFARVGGREGEQNKNSIPGRDLESHNLGREWSPTSFPYCLESQFSSGGWQGLHPRGFHSKVWGSPQKAHSPWSFHEGADTGSREDPEWIHTTLPWTVSPLTRHPRAPDPELFEDNTVGVLSSFCLKVTCLTSTMGMQSSRYPYRILRWNKIIHVTHLLEEWQWELLFTTSF